MRVLPSGFHRISHYGLLVSGTRAVPHAARSLSSTAARLQRGLGP
jgi:hypothetical protein